MTEAEWVHRITKGDLEVRPIWQHREHRLPARTLVCFLAYLLWKTPAQWIRRSDLGDTPRTVLEELAKIKSGDVVLPGGLRSG